MAISISQKRVLLMCGLIRLPAAISASFLGWSVAADSRV